MFQNLILSSDTFQIRDIQVAVYADTPDLKSEAPLVLSIRYRDSQPVSAN